MTHPTTAADLQDTATDEALCPECGAETAVDADLRLQAHGGYEGKPKVCAGGGKAAGHFTAPLFPKRPKRALRPVVAKVASVRFQTEEAWRTRLTCAKCSKIETLPYATFEPVLMPFHGKWVQGNREPCPGGEQIAGTQKLITRKADRSDMMVGIGSVIVILVLAFFALSSCFGDDDADTAYDSNDVSSYDTSDGYQAPSRSTAQAAPRTQDTSIRDYVRAAGISDQLVGQLGQVAGDTGYGLTRGVPLAFDDAQSFAVVMIDNCRELNAGTVSIEQMISRDVSDGAPVADARAMAAFLQQTFCPAVR